MKSTQEKTMGIKRDKVSIKINNKHNRTSFYRME